MLFSPYVCGFGSLYDNIGATISEAGMGTSVPAGGSANTKSATVQLISGATIQKNVYGIAILFFNGAVSAATRRYLIDIMYDPAGGTNWQVLIPDLFANSPHLGGGGGVRYYFPIQIPAGSSVGARTAGSAASSTLQVVIQLYGEPSRQEVGKFGTFVENFGVVSGTTSGTAIVPGTNAVGAYVSLGTTVKDMWWWQCGGIGQGDTTMAIKSYQIDVAAGDATFKKTLVDNCIQINNAGEQSGKEAFGMKPPIRLIPGGTTIFARAACSAAPDSSPSTTAYGMG